MILPDQRSIVAVDPTTRGLAYVVFDRGELVDWGHRRCGRKEREVLWFLDELLALSAADALVFEDPAAVGARRRPRVRRLLGLMAMLARRRKIAAVPVARSAIHRAWALRGLTTKEAVAAAIAAQLPELEPHVPPARKTWMSENPHVNIFDAVSLALHVFDSAHLGP